MAIYDYLKDKVNQVEKTGSELTYRMFGDKYKINYDDVKRALLGTVNPLRGLYPMIQKTGILNKVMPAFQQGYGSVQQATSNASTDQNQTIPATQQTDTIQEQPQPIVESKSAVNTFLNTGVIPSTALATPKTMSDIRDISQQRGGINMRLMELSTPSSNELELRNQIIENQNALDTIETKMQEYENNLRSTPSLNIAGQNVNSFEFQQAQNLKTQVLQRQQSLLLKRLELAQGDREKTLATLKDLTKFTEPNVLKTDVNETTGDVYAFIQDPTTGTIQQKNIGNVGASTKPYVNTGTYRNENNEQVFWGMTQDGQIQQKVLGMSGVGDGAGTSSAERKAVAAIQLYGTTIADAISSGQSPEQAVNSVALQTGLDVETAGLMLPAAQQIAQRLQQTTKTQEQAAPEDTGFLKSLWTILINQ